MKIKFLPFYAFSLLPMAVAYLFSDAVYFIVYRIVKYRREVVYQNIRKAFPKKNELEIREIEKKFYKHFCDVVFESFKVLTISKKQINKRFKIVNLELLEKYYRENKHILLYAAHHGNWEWLSFSKLQTPLKVITLYQPQSNKYFDELSITIRERCGVKCVPSNKGFRTIMGLINGNEPSLSALIGDQSPPKESARHWVKFLNQDTTFLMGVDRIHKRTKQVVLFPSFKKVKRGYYELEFKIIDTQNHFESDYPLIDSYAKILEETINESPEMWLWSHRRWKLSKPQHINIKQKSMERIPEQKREYILD